MSELPELKIMIRQINNKTISKKIVSFDLFDFQLKNTQRDSLNNKILNHYIKESYCLGELIVIKLSSSYYLLINMQSTGYFAYLEANDSNSIKNTKMQFVFFNGFKLFFIDHRAYSYLTLLNQKELDKLKLKIGVDPLGKKFDYINFRQLLKNRTAGIKNILINDSIFQGIGNIYADEICFDARVNPGRGVKTLSEAEMKRIFKSISKILKKSLEYDGLSFYWPASFKKIRFDRFLNVYNHEGERCVRCRSGIIQKSKDRTTYFFCPLCQN